MYYSSQRDNVIWIVLGTNSLPIYIMFHILWYEANNRKYNSASTNVFGSYQPSLRLTSQVTSHNSLLAANRSTSFLYIASKCKDVTAEKLSAKRQYHQRRPLLVRHFQPILLLWIWSLRCQTIFMTCSHRKWVKE